MKNMKLKQNILDLKHYIESCIVDLQEEYENIDGKSTPDSFRINMKLKHILENQRSVLDYLARYIVQELLIICKNDHTYFPLVWKNCSQEIFEEKLNTKFFPNLKMVHREIYDFLVWVQGFGQNPNLFQEFSRISNYTKHENLLEQDIGEFQVVQIKYNDKIYMMIGDGCLQAINIQQGRISINIDQITSVSIRGPQYIDKYTTTFIDADPGIYIETIKFCDYKIHNCSYSVKNFIKIIDVNIDRILQKIFAVL